MTNADVIRSKTDEELAELFTSKTPFMDGKYSSGHGDCYSENRELCLKEELKWLQKEARHSSNKPNNIFDEAINEISNIEGCFDNLKYYC